MSHVSHPPKNGRELEGSMNTLYVSTTQTYIIFNTNLNNKMSITISSKKKKNVDYVVNKDITYSLYCICLRYLYLYLLINRIVFFSFLI